MEDDKNIDVPDFPGNPGTYCWVYQLSWPNITLKNS